jgi:hypothetical protein
MNTNPQKKEMLYEEVEPYASPVRLADLLSEIESTINTHVVVRPEAAVALAAWVVHTYVYRQRDAVAYVAIQSPEKRCGKTTLLSVIAGMANRPLVASNISVGALFRAIDEAGPTLLIDEADTYLGRSSTMRGILNCGNTRRTAYVLRLAKIGQRQPKGEADEEDDRGSSVVRYSCWCPKAIAMIGKVPETLADRSIVVNMQRKLTAEKCAPLADFNPALIVQKCARWSLDEEQDVADWPRLGNEKLNDRASDTYEPLFVIGAMAGSPWEAKIRNAAEVLCAFENTEPDAASLILDIMGVFITTEAKRVFSKDLAEALKGKSGWVTYDVTSREAVTELGIAQKLRRYNIRPTTVRIGPKVSKGYKWEQFLGALEHYVPKEEVRLKLAELREMNNLAREAEAEQNAQKELQKGGVTGVAEPLKPGLHDVVPGTSSDNCTKIAEFLAENGQVSDVETLQSLEGSGEKGRKLVEKHDKLLQKEQHLKAQQDELEQKFEQQLGRTIKVGEEFDRQSVVESNPMLSAEQAQTVQPQQL